MTYAAKPPSKPRCDGRAAQIARSPRRPRHPQDRVNDYPQDPAIATMIIAINVHQHVERIPSSSCLAPILTEVSEVSPVRQRPEAGLRDIYLVPRPCPRRGGRAGRLTLPCPASRDPVHSAAARINRACSVNQTVDCRPDQRCTPRSLGRWSSDLCADDMLLLLRSGCCSDLDR